MRSESSGADPRIIRLTAGTAQDLSLIGGKACGLIRLMRAGLDVPDAWCITTAALRDPQDTQLEAALGRLFDEIARTTRRSPCRIAVRSSATVEDLTGTSAAGVYLTVLGVGDAAGLLSAVRRCADAFHSDHARAYRESSGHEGGEIALVIQRQLSPTVSGVLLTTNPLRPFAPEYVIDAGYGLGEGLVSGRVDPDHLVIDSGSGEILDKRVGAKKFQLVMDDAGGVIERQVSDSRAKRLCLKPAQTAELVALARLIESEIAPAQDCEWAIERNKLYALQVRPITGLPSRHPKEVWSRRFGDAYLSSWTSPLGHTFLTRWITEWMFQDLSRRVGRADLAKVDPLRRYHGYVYISGSYVRSMMEAMPASIRAAGGSGDDSWFTPLWMEEIRSAPFDPIRMIRMLTLPLTDPRGPMSRNIKALANHCARIEEEIASKLAQNYSALSTDEWFDQIHEIDEFGAEHFRVIRWGMGQHSTLLHALLQGLLRSWCKDDGSLYREIVSGLPGMRTTEINRDIWHLGLTARSDAELRERILDDSQYADLRRELPSALLWPELDRFLERHGHRSASREIAEERWAERPDLILGFVRAQLHAAEAPPDPVSIENRAVNRRRAAEAEAIERAGRGLGGRIRSTLLRTVIDRTQTFTRYREDQRYHLDYLLAHCRQLVLEMGKRLASERVLDDPGHVFFMEADEFFSAARSPAPSASLTAAIDERIADWVKWRDRLPATFLFDDVETEGEMAEGRYGAESPVRADGDLSGLGASRGRASGRVVVVRAIEQLAEIEPGDILVTETIDPGWTSVFPLLGGIVTETGGILSHGALLAREYGIPAVMAITGAMERLSDGQTVEIDGDTGQIHC